MILHEIRYDRTTDTVQLLYKEFPGSTVYRVFSYDGKMAQRFRDVVAFTEKKAVDDYISRVEQTV